MEEEIGGFVSVLSTLSLLSYSSTVITTVLNKSQLILSTTPQLLNKLKVLLQVQTLELKIHSHHQMRLECGLEVLEAHS